MGRLAHNRGVGFVATRAAGDRPRSATRKARRRLRAASARGVGVNRSAVVFSPLKPLQL